MVKIQFVVNLNNKASSHMKSNNPFISISKDILLFFILFCGLNVGWAVDKSNKDPFGHITNPTPDNLPTYSGTCEDLYPSTSFNHLLTQIYQHLDDDCLYLMPTDELSKKLGVEVYAYRDMKTGHSIKDRYDELAQRPFTDFNSGISLRKDVLVLKDRSIEKLSLQEQRQHYIKKDKKGEMGSIEYNIIFSSAYLDTQPLPFYKDKPETLPTPNHFYRFYVAHNPCSTVDEKNSFHKNQWLKRSGGYVWYGYTSSRIRFRNCSTGATGFRFSKLFYLGGGNK